MAPGVRKIPTAIACPMISATAGPSVSWRVSAGVGIRMSSPWPGENLSALEGMMCWKGIRELVPRTH